MADTSELVVASWNAEIAFGDGNLSKKRMDQAFEVVEGLGDDVDVLAIPELALRRPGGEPLPEERIQEIRGHMADLGYLRGIITGYSPFRDGIRDDLFLSLWTRVDGEMSLPFLGGQYLPQIRVPGFGRVTGVHNRSDSEPPRIEVAKAYVQSVARDDGTIEGEIKIGDYNTGYADDEQVRWRRRFDHVVRHIPRIIEMDYYNQSKRWQYLAGMVVRACAMTRGDAMSVYREAGFHDADPGYQPTVFARKLGISLDQRIDHIIASPDIDLRDFQVLPRSVGEDEEPVSDHAPVRARAVKRQLVEATTSDLAELARA
jgi:hypothetical protein